MAEYNVVVLDLKQPNLVMIQSVGFNLSTVYNEEVATAKESSNLDAFLVEDEYVDFSSKAIQQCASELFEQSVSDTEKARIAYEFVRDEIPHSFDCNADVITAKASDVLRHKTGICHAKANLLAALLRSQKIPAGFCFQHITLADDESLGYCVHAYNAVFLNGKWIKLDARGNKPGVNAQFSLEEPVLAFANREEYDEYFWNGVYAQPHAATMDMLEHATCLQDVLDNIPDSVEELPDINHRLVNMNGTPSFDNQFSATGGQTTGFDS